MTECRRRCSGDSFDHDPTVMSIAKAGELLRCPVCLREAEIGPSGADHVDATPTPRTDRTPVRLSE